jgi:hypothetical protein
MWLKDIYHALYYLVIIEEAASGDLTSGPTFNILHIVSGRTDLKSSKHAYLWEL